MSRYTISQVIDDETQAGKTFVDCFGFFFCLTFCSGLCNLLTTSQIDQVKLACFRRIISWIVLCHSHDEARVTPRWLGVHVCAADCSVLVSEVQQTVHLRLFRHECFHDVFYVDAGLLVLSNLQIRLWGVQQVSDFLHVDFDHTDLHREFDLVRRGEDLPEHEAYHAWNHASFLGVVDGRPKHGMRLTRTGLPIGKDSAIEALHNTFAHGPDSPIED